LASHCHRTYASALVCVCARARARTRARVCTDSPQQVRPRRLAYHTDCGAACALGAPSGPVQSSECSRNQNPSKDTRMHLRACLRACVRARARVCATEELQDTLSYSHLTTMPRCAAYTTRNNQQQGKTHLADCRPQVQHRRTIGVRGRIDCFLLLCTHHIHTRTHSRG